MPDSMEDWIDALMQSSKKRPCGGPHIHLDGSGEVTMECPPSPPTLATALSMLVELGGAVSIADAEGEIRFRITPLPKCGDAQSAARL
jgi:hypothetical protein